MTVIKGIVTRANLEPVNPWELTSPEEIAKVESIPDSKAKMEALTALNRTMGRRNQDAIDSCDYVLACLDGPDVDSGTSSEIGYAHAKGKVIFGDRCDFRLTGDNEGTIVHLPVQYWTEQSGATIARWTGQLKQLLRTVGPKART